MEFNFEDVFWIDIARAIYWKLVDFIEEHGSISIAGIYDVYSLYTGDYSYQPKFIDNRYGYTDINDIHLSFRSGEKYDRFLDEFIPMENAKLWFSKPKRLY